VELLLMQDGIDVNAKDKNGWTPLSFAAAAGSEEVVKILLERDDIEIDSKSTTRSSMTTGPFRSTIWAAVGQTPLSLAARQGSEAVVELLLTRKSIDVNAKDTNGRTPLSLAAEAASEAVVRLLLMQDRIDLNAKDTNGRTPLSFAAEARSKMVVQLLLMQDGINANAKDTNGCTPLSFAAAARSEAVVKMLLERFDIETDSKVTTSSGLQ